MNITSPNKSNNNENIGIAVIIALMVILVNPQIQLLKRLLGHIWTHFGNLVIVVIYIIII